MFCSGDIEICLTFKQHYCIYYIILHNYVMQCDVCSSIIYISNKSQYLKKQSESFFQSYALEVLK